MGKSEERKIFSHEDWFQAEAPSSSFLVEIQMTSALITASKTKSMSEIYPHDQMIPSNTKK
jgi:hypothetical protein